LLKRCCHKPGRTADDRFSQELPIKPLEREISNHWPEHAHGLEKIGNIPFATGARYARTEQIVRSVDMDNIEFQPFAAEPKNTGIPGKRTVAAACEKIVRLDAVFFESPTFRCPSNPARELHRAFDSQI